MQTTTIAWWYRWPCGWHTAALWRLATLTVALLAGVALPLRSAAGPVTDPARDTRRPLLWRIGTAAAPSYLFGTIHVADPRVLELLHTVAPTFDSCDALRTEIPLDPRALQQIQEATLLPEQKTLRDILPAALLQRIEATLAQRQQPLEPFLRLKPWVLASLLDMMDAPGMFEMPLDQRLYTRALQREMSVGGLETVTEQLHILDSLPDSSAAQLLTDSLDQLESDQDALEDLIVAYLDGDADAILQTIVAAQEGSDPVVQHYFGRLIDARNVLMAERIDAILRQSPQQRVFFAIGAGHLGGTDGVVARLRRQGHVVTRLGD